MSQNLSEKYENKIEKEDHLCKQIKTCEQFLTSTFDNVYRHFKEMENDISIEILLTIQAMQHKLERERLQLRLEKIRLSHEIKQHKQFMKDFR